MLSLSLPILNSIILGKPKVFFVISRYSEELSWIKDFNFDYVVYNKNPEIDGYNTIKVDNVGANRCSELFHVLI